MKNTFKYILISALLGAAMLPAQAAIQNYSFSGVIDSGYYSGQAFSGSFSFDDATVDALDLDIVNLLSLNISILNKNFTLADSSVAPDVSFQDGSFLGLSWSVDSTTPDIGFTFVAGSTDSSQAFFTYTTQLGFAGAASIVYTQTAVIPEADTYAMLLAGLGVIGLIARSRKLA